MNIRIEKFGGSSFKERSDYRGLARRLKAELHAQRGSKFVLVVSAFPGLTEDFRAMAKEVNPSPRFESIDALLPMADCISAVLLRHACDAEEVTATTLFGHQHGIVTDSNFSRARIVHRNPEPLLQALGDYDVVVIPGGPAVDGRGRPTWLGKNSSDLTAVAMAATLKASECSIYSDVEGVYTADPNQLPEARLMNNVSYEMAITMSENGAKVIHHKAVRLAQTSNVKIQCRLNRVPYTAGTCIGEHGTDAAVVSDARSQVFQFQARGELDHARTVLEALDLPTFGLTVKGEHYCIVPGGFVDIEPIFHAHGIRGSKTDQKLLTVVAPDGEMQQHLVASSDLVATAAAELRAMNETQRPGLGASR